MPYNFISEGGFTMKKRLVLVSLAIIISMFIFADKFIVIETDTLTMYRVEAFDLIEITVDEIYLEKDLKSSWDSSVSLRLELSNDLEKQKYMKLQQMLASGQTIAMPPTKTGESVAGKIITVEWLKNEKKSRLTEDFVEFMNSPEENVFDLSKWLDDWAEWIPVKLD